MICILRHRLQRKTTSAAVWLLFCKCKLEFYTALEGARNQFAREAMAGLTWSNWNLDEELVQKLLSHAFSVPFTTKPYAEDVFRDMRSAFLNVPTSRVSPWSRLHAALQSLLNRDDKKILKVMSPKRESIKAFQFHTLSCLAGYPRLAM